MDYLKLSILGIVTLVAAMAANWAHDISYQFHALLIMVVAFAMFVMTLRKTEDEPTPIDASGYEDGVIRAGNAS